MRRRRTTLSVLALTLVGPTTVVPGAPTASAQAEPDLIWCDATGALRASTARRFAWQAVALLALLLSACQVRQEIRFEEDGSGTASITVGIDESCQPPSPCPKRLERLLGGEGPLANAAADAESLPFDVVIEPFASGPPESAADETGYTLSFDFAGLDDLEQKLAPDPSTGKSQTSAFTIRGMTFEENQDGGFTFTAEVSVPGGGPNTSADHVSFAVVLPGSEGEHNATVAEGAFGAVRFQWNYEAGEPQTTLLQASTCSIGGTEEGKDACGGSALISGGVAIAAAVVAVAAAALVLMRRRGGERPGQQDLT